MGLQPGHRVRCTCLAAAGFGQPRQCIRTRPPPTLAHMSDLYDLTMRSITGEEVSLSDYRGQVVLIVNVASL